MGRRSGERIGVLTILTTRRGEGRWERRGEERVELIIMPSGEKRGERRWELTIMISEKMKGEGN